MRNSDWSSDVCSSDLTGRHGRSGTLHVDRLCYCRSCCPVQVSHYDASTLGSQSLGQCTADSPAATGDNCYLLGNLHERFLSLASYLRADSDPRLPSCIVESGVSFNRRIATVTRTNSDEHTSEVQSLTRISYA